MKYFEFKEPYYALITARNQTSAVITYSNDVCTLEDFNYEDTVNSITEIDKESAWKKFKSGQSEDGDNIPEAELKEDFESTQTVALLIDRSLI